MRLEIFTEIQKEAKPLWFFEGWAQRGGHGDIRKLLARNHFSSLYLYRLTLWEAKEAWFPCRVTGGLWHSDVTFLAIGLQEQAPTASWSLQFAQQVDVETLRGSWDWRGSSCHGRWCCPSGMLGWCGHITMGENQEGQTVGSEVSSVLRPLVTNPLMLNRLKWWQWWDFRLI